MCGSSFRNMIRRNELFAFVEIDADALKTQPIGR